MTQELAASIKSIAEEIEAAAVTTITTVREYQIRYFWEIGQILNGADIPITELIKGLTREESMVRIHMSERSLWDALKIYQAYPNFEKVYETPHGQNISITKLRAIMSPSTEKPEVADLDIAKSLIKRIGHDRAHAVARVILTL